MLSAVLILLASGCDNKGEEDDDGGFIIDDDEEYGADSGDTDESYGTDSSGARHLHDRIPAHTRQPQYRQCLQHRHPLGLGSHQPQPLHPPH